MYGAAIATLLSYVLQFIVIFIYTQRLIPIIYDYAFIFKSIAVSLCFFGGVLSLSYLNINAMISLGLKAILFLLFVFLSYKFLELKKAVRRILNYGVIPKETIS